MQARVFRLGLVERLRGSPCGQAAHGFTLLEVHVGRALVYYASEGRRRVVTTPVRRILDSPAGVRYAETENSLYRIDTSSFAAARVRTLATRAPENDGA